MAAGWVGNVRVVVLGEVKEGLAKRVYKDGISAGFGFIV